MQPEIHLFLIWNHGLIKRQEIITDIHRNFEIIHIENIKWSSQNYAQNLSRFYGQRLPTGSFKEIECGKGYFTLIIVRDLSPFYEDRTTTAGVKYINAKMFDAKMKYRSWTSGGHKIHATNTPQETRKDLVLLTGKTYAYYEKQSVMAGAAPDNIIHRNITGCIQWKSLEELFLVLNESIEYVVLRNFEGMPQSYYAAGHGDIDLLVSDVKEAAYICNGTRIYFEKNSVNFKVNIDYETIIFDLRYVGDGYYDKNWALDILETRQQQNSIYVPRQDHYQYSLLYHTLMHKASISADYEALFAQWGFSPQNYMQELKEFMNKHNYQFTEPLDCGAFYNFGRLNQSTSFRRRRHTVITLAKRALNKAVRISVGKYNGAKVRLRTIAKRMGLWNKS